uniref:Phytocyanin domain-containing protein n=1 Tax=Fagus sylvatica TaxID=28930 RepID=A0A2N9IW17_FAGSY
MAGLKNIVVVALVIISMSLEVNWVGAQGAPCGRRVGDKIWFTYSAAQESIIELKGKEEYESCDISNPIKMYTDGLDGISLDGEGIRYFVSSKPESCKNGLKLHVEVVPEGTPEIPKIASSTLASGPTTPSGSAHLIGSSILLAFGFLCYAIIGA